MSSFKHNLHTIVLLAICMAFILYAKIKAQIQEHAFYFLKLEKVTDTIAKRRIRKHHLFTKYAVFGRRKEEDYFHPVLLSFFVFFFVCVYFFLPHSIVFRSVHSKVYFLVEINLWFCCFCSTHNDAES